MRAAWLIALGALLSFGAAGCRGHDQAEQRDDQTQEKRDTVPMPTQGIPTSSTPPNWSPPNVPPMPTNAPPPQSANPQPGGPPLPSTGVPNAPPDESQQQGGTGGAGTAGKGGQTVRNCDGSTARDDQPCPPGSPASEGGQKR